MKNFKLVFLVALAFLFNTCKKENIKKEFPWLIGKWHYYGSSVTQYCYRSSGGVTHIENIYYDTIADVKTNHNLTNSFKVTFDKKNIEIEHNSKLYRAYVSKYDYDITDIYNLDFGGSIMDAMNFAPLTSDIVVKTDFAYLKLEYKESSFSKSYNPIICKMLTATKKDGKIKDFLQVCFTDILGKPMVYTTAYFQKFGWNCGNRSLIILTFEKI